MNGEHILAVYEDISCISGLMLLAARNQDWEELVSLEQQCKAKFGALLQVEDRLPRDAQFQREKSVLIQRVLDHDAQIRDIVEPQLAKLNGLIGNSQQQKRLARTYTTDI